MSKQEQLLERIEWVLANRPHLVERGKPSQRKWSSLARYADGTSLAITQVNTIVLRIQKWVKEGKRGAEPTQEVATLEALADAAQVSRHWFVQGIGGPDDKDVFTTSGRVHPTIADVAKAAGFTDDEAESASASVRGLHGTDSMTEEQAREILEETRRQRKNLARMLREPATSIDEDSLGGGLAEVAKVNPRRKR